MRIAPRLQLLRGKTGSGHRHRHRQPAGKDEYLITPLFVPAVPGIRLTGHDGREPWPGCRCAGAHPAAAAFAHRDLFDEAAASSGESADTDSLDCNCTD